MKKALGQELNRYVGKPCPYCGRTMTVSGSRCATRDHLRPRAEGNSLLRNKAVVCSDCNEDKGPMTLDDWLLRLVAQPQPRRLIVELRIKMVARLLVHLRYLQYYSLI